MQEFQNPFEGIIFPQYRKYKNGKSFFKILSATAFEEKTFIGRKKFVNRIEARILPDRNFIMDLVLHYHPFADAISPEEYEAA